MMSNSIKQNALNVNLVEVYNMKEMTSNPHQENIAFYTEIDDILSHMLKYNTKSYKVAELKSRIEDLENVEDDFWENYVKSMKNKLNELNEIESHKQSYTFMFFENKSSLESFVKNDFSIALKDFEVVYANAKIRLLNNKNSIIMDLFLIEDLEKILNKLKDESLSIVFDNTYNYYKRTNENIVRLINLHYRDQKNITFVFDYEAQINCERDSKN